MPDTRTMTGRTWRAALAAAWLACLPIGYAHGATGEREFRSHADDICASAVGQLKPLEQRLVEIADALEANDPSARAEYATLATSTIAIHRHADRRLSRVRPPHTLARRYRAMLAIDRLRFGPQAERLAALYRQPSSPETDAEIARLSKLQDARRDRFQRLVRRLRLSDCRNLD
jgi:hypothetical protein